MKELTRAEEEIMQELWKKEKVFVKEIVDQMPEPKPAYNTVSTIVRILQQKGFVDHDVVGKSHKYFPVISKEEYSSKFLNGFVKRFFNGSYSQMISFFINENALSLHELKDVLKELKEEK